MIPENLYAPTMRSLKDIQSQAELVARGSDEEEPILQFASYSNELKDFLQKHVEDPECLALIGRIPQVQITIVESEEPNALLKIIGYILLVGFLQSYIVSQLAEARARRLAIWQILECRGLYASIELRLRMLQG